MSSSSPSAQGHGRPGVENCGLAFAPPPPSRFSRRDFFPFGNPGFRRIFGSSPARRIRSFSDSCTRCSTRVEYKACHHSTSWSATKSALVRFSKPVSPCIGRDRSPQEETSPRPEKTKKRNKTRASSLPVFLTTGPRTILRQLDARVRHELAADRCRTATWRMTGKVARKHLPRHWEAQRNHTAFRRAGGSNPRRPRSRSGSDQRASRCSLSRARP